MDFNLAASNLLKILQTSGRQLWTWAEAHSTTAIIIAIALIFIFMLYLRYND